MAPHQVMTEDELGRPWQLTCVTSPRSTLASRKQYWIACEGNQAQCLMRRNRSSSAPASNFAIAQDASRSVGVVGIDPED
jgi:hypothetical protein